MKRYALIIGFVSTVMGVGTHATAGPGNVRFTKHNLSNNMDVSKGLPIGAGADQRRIYSLEVDQECIFCHTPHNAQPVMPLWNKAMPNQTFNLYTSSRSLTPTARSASLPAGSVSLLCLSCHDGKTAINVLHNASQISSMADNGIDKIVDIGGDYDNAMGGFPSPPTGGISLGIFGGFGEYPSNMGKTDGDDFAGNNLADDHPIGFSYTAAQGESNDRLRLPEDVNTMSSGKIRFFSPNNSVECSSCHDPHVNYTVGAGTPAGDPALKPFLVMSNVGSAMCLACHNK